MPKTTVRTSKRLKLTKSKIIPVFSLDLDYLVIKQMTSTEVTHVITDHREYWYSF